MVIVRLMGGLGNQMFQYALGRKISMMTRQSLWVDTSFLKKKFGPQVTKRSYALGDFCISARKIPNFAGEALYESFTSSNGSAIKFLLGDYIKLRSENKLDFDTSLLTLKGSCLLNGYWQSEKYFSDVRETILQDFSLKKSLKSILENIAKESDVRNAASVHVRRGDYVSSPDAAAFHGVCSAKWYEEAIRFMRSRTGVNKFVVFSDDIQWARENIFFDCQVVFVEKKFGLTDSLELHLMSRCKHHIIANSSFSWWGAWLNTDPRKTVIAPMQWFIGSSTTRDRIPSDWILM